jgi:hypothetical protein
MKVHFESPNPMSFLKKHLNDVEVNIFFPFPSSYHHNLNIFLKLIKIWALKKSIY